MKRKKKRKNWKVFSNVIPWGNQYLYRKHYLKESDIAVDNISQFFQTIYFLLYLERWTRPLFQPLINPSESNNSRRKVEFFSPFLRLFLPCASFSLLLLPLFLRTSYRFPLLKRIIFDLFFNTLNKKRKRKIYREPVLKVFFLGFFLFEKKKNLFQIKKKKMSVCLHILKRYFFEWLFLYRRIIGINNKYF